MKKGLILALSVFLVIALSGCAKKKAVHEEATDAINLDTLETSNAASQTANAATPATSGVSLDATTPQSAVAPSTEPASPVSAATSSAPTLRDIQTALKNAGVYAGAITGKTGPKTKAAIKDFQKANGLTADGKVGPKTWSKLSTYLTGSAATATAATTAAPAADATAAPAKPRKTTKHVKRSVSEPPAE